MTAGNLRAEGDEPVTASRMYRLMSMTKAAGSVGALQLVESGELRLDQEVASIVSEFGEIKVLEGFDGDSPRLREPEQSARVQHLFTHTEWSYGIGSGATGSVSTGWAW